MKHVKFFENQQDKVYVFTISESWVEIYIKIFRDKESAENYILYYVNTEFRDNENAQNVLRDDFEDYYIDYCIKKDKEILFLDPKIAMEFYNTQNAPPFRSTRKEMKVTIYNAETFIDKELEIYLNAKKYNL